MKLPSQSIRKLFRENFSGRAPIPVDRADRLALSRKWREQIEDIDGVRVTHHPGDRDSRSRTLCRFTIPEPGADQAYLRRDELRLEFDDQARLVLNSYRQRQCEHTALVSSVEEIRDLVRDVLQIYAHRRAGERKHQRVRQLQSNAILAKVRQLALEDEFDFATVTDDATLRLFVQVTPEDALEIGIPMQQFDRLLPRLREAIAALRGLYDEGFRFKVVKVERVPADADWVRIARE
ncbi:hypothetical protein FYK55_06820 [Roseiconus nitratireducens]|uniref:Uncharacterized protein n=1 Tax=Roseiconus nitratireducens TaxID=2605748 RepID=A0A5M6DGM8_9BACT|nr:hypothetical protein [Roseiconus nitratireducens]KAA5545359.1 hypothetical protein FYK55_06820 [Roseiconus nitratireducens]